MSGENLLKTSGLIGLLGGLLNIAGSLLHPVGEIAAAIATSTWVPAHLVVWLA